MTNRDFFTAITNNNLTKEVIEHASMELAKMDERNAKRAATPSKTAIANEPLKAKIIEFLAGKQELMLSSVIGEAVGISTTKASALCKQLAKVGTIESTEVKVPKVGKRTAWQIAKEETEEVETEEVETEE